MSECAHMVERVFISCVNEKQVRVADRYADLMVKKLDRRLSSAFDSFLPATGPALVAHLWRAEIEKIRCIQLFYIKKYAPR